MTPNLAFEGSAEQRRCSVLLSLRGASSTRRFSPSRGEGENPGGKRRLPSALAQTDRQRTRQRSLIF